MGYYRTAQICLNGHCISDSVDAYPQHSQPFCSQCGAPTITSCPSCSAKIRGDYHEDGLAYLSAKYTVPAYCYNCGEPYPWTKAAIDSLVDLISEDEELNTLQQEILAKSLPDIVAETPKTKVATTRIKKALLSAGKFTAEAIREFVIDFGCELAKSMLFP